MNVLLHDLWVSQKRVQEWTKQIEEIKESTKILNSELRDKIKWSCRTKTRFAKSREDVAKCSELTSSTLWRKIQMGDSSWWN